GTPKTLPSTQQSCGPKEVLGHLFEYLVVLSPGHNAPIFRQVPRKSKLRDGTQRAVLPRYRVHISRSQRKEIEDFLAAYQYAIKSLAKPGIARTVPFGNTPGI
ncbi:MAG TPA: hypothetical protein VFF42_00780, partial [Candidatus Eremiobacteraceae bacterium]|nr:hypothetical protein [Candidatus Eremiobacteraceae bacterium]